MIRGVLEQVSCPERSEGLRDEKMVRDGPNSKKLTFYSYRENYPHMFLLSSPRYIPLAVFYLHCDQSRVMGAPT